MRLRSLCVALALVLALCALPASASAASSLERITGYKSPGTPAKYNKVGILKIGPKREEHPRAEPRHVGQRRLLRAAGAGDRGKAQGWQVWAVERRENLLEDHSVSTAPRPARPRGRRCSTTTSAG